MTDFYQPPISIDLQRIIDALPSVTDRTELTDYLNEIERRDRQRFVQQRPNPFHFVAFFLRTERVAYILKFKGPNPAINASKFADFSKWLTGSDLIEFGGFGDVEPLINVTYNQWLQVRMTWDGDSLIEIEERLMSDRE